MKRTFPAPGPNEPSQRSIAFQDDARLGKTICYLFERWQDESQYEDVQEYKKPLLPIAADYDIQIVKMNKRPFGFNFIADGREFQVKVTETKKKSMKDCLVAQTQIKIMCERVK